MNNGDNQTIASQNTTGNTASLSQLTDITEAFSVDDFAHVTSDEFKNNPLVGKMMTMLYAATANKLKEADNTILELTGSVKYYQSFPISNIGFSIMNIIGTIIVGIGASLSNQLFLIILGGLLVLAGNILPIIFIKNGEKKK